MNQLTIQALEGIVDEKGYIEHQFPDVDYTQTPEEVEEEITQYGAKINGTVIDMQTANVLLTVYKALKEDGSKQKFRRMLRTLRNFEKLVAFSWGAVD